ncbi:TonB-dependent receptor plug domain-containing protein [Alteromonas gracilis]|uniref:TonB-dependent receptor n=1 Tax=Alteromonas gracilis TaxID=1479524 RepID=A0ABX5CKC6_9ALTE|nr:TonB-dependent receptor [Alteromonas gracilis]PRO68009.1 TonB-dependent receptor [Alteromonas gracilis]
MFHKTLSLFLSALPLSVLAAENADVISTVTAEANVEKITIEGAATANDKPVGTFNSPISNLEYDPRVDLQSRNMAEAQADVTIRGGIFENTGFRVGSATLIDPQTGHYFAEIPIAPEMLTKPSIFTGVDNALYGVNSSVGTVSFGWKPIQKGGSVSIGAGNNYFNLQRVHGASTMLLESYPAWSVGIEGEYSRSESDGTIANGDHQFERMSGRVQLASERSQTDLFYGFQQKFFGWPNLYTPFNVNETEDIETRLVMLNHRQGYGEKGMENTVEVSAYYRENDDHYVFSRENPEAFQAFHETEVKSLALSGTHNLSQDFGINYSAQFTADDIKSTTLENNFTSRDYYKVSVVPEYRAKLNSNESLTIRLGGAFDDTNRDDDRLSVVGDISWLTQLDRHASRTFYVSYAEATQVAGYTAIGGSTTSGLFRSNNQLKREVSKNLEIGASFDDQSWKFDTALFYRWDNELTDWTYSFDSTSARSANPVDIETLGVEFIAIKRFDNADVVASYTYLDKSEDYGIDGVDASFYALNYPPHRATLGLVWFATDTVEVRIDNEWRKQETNALRNGSDSAFFSHATLTYSPAQIEGLNLVLAVDNLWNERFEEIPGTPGRGEQYSATLTYFW